MLELKNINKYYGNQKVIENINLKLPDVGLFLIKGKSGIGKTTLFNIISHLDTPTDGDIYYNGKSYKEMKENDIANLRKEIGFIFQDSSLINNLTIKDNLELVKLIAKTNISIEDTLNKLGISNVINKYPNILSGGEKQRVAIAIALIKNAKIILADEPTSNLDEETREEVFKILEEISKERLVLIVSHDSYLIENIKNNILLSDLFNNNIDYSNDLKIKENNEKIKLNPINYLKYSFKLIKKNKGLYIFSSLILLIIMFCSILLFSCYYTNKEKAITRLYNYYNIDKFVIYDIRYDADELEKNITLDVDEFKEKYSNSEIRRIYYTSLLRSEREAPYGIVIDNTLADDEIKIDDILLEERFQKYENSNYINILGVDFKIKEIIKHDKKFEELDNNCSYAMCIYMNNDVFNKFNDIEFLKDYYGYYFLRNDVSMPINYDESLAEDEVIVNKYYFGIESSGDEHYGEEAKFYGKTFKVAGISDSNIIYFNKDVFNELINTYSYTPYNMSRFIGLEISLNDDTIKILNDTYDIKDGINIAKITLNSPLSIYVDKILTFYDTTVVNLLRVIYPIALICLLIILLFILYSFYKNYKRDMGFILSLGANKLILIIIYFIPLIFILFCLTIIGSLLIIPLIKPLNDILLELLNFKIDIKIINLNILAILTSFSIILLCFILCLSIIYMMLSKKRTINIIYDR